MAKSRQAFTLVELLVAIALAALVVAAVVASLAGGLRIWDRARAGSSPLLDAAVALEWIQRDIHSMTAARLLRFEGSADRVRIPVLASGDGGTPELKDVSYSMQTGEGRLERLCSTWPSNALESAPGEVLLEGVDAVRFAYCGDDGRWVTAWERGTNRPSAVDVTIRFNHDKGGLEIRRTIEIPGARGR